MYKNTSLKVVRVAYNLRYTNGRETSFSYAAKVHFHWIWNISRDAVHVLIQRRIQMIARLNYAYTINFNGIERDSEHFLRVCGAVKMHRLPSLPLVYRRLSMSFRVVPQPMKFHPSGDSAIMDEKG